MTKTDKKRDAQIIKQLKSVCNEFKHSVNGFEFISHEVNFKQLNQSLNISIYLSNDSAISALNLSEQKNAVSMVVSSLKEIAITLTDPAKQIHWRAKSER